ncbi:TetR/AcrR family transcriptional regulator [Nocardia sp. BSTN01]|uniref:TetR/AcrR family transcriptional regulator n=1 Tax=Nocardia sp. BSTN01 TaxID=2783665 RepID=UPI0018904C87|nr:TetR/AcrR family transcriptional regulator [Nocardia sp. BSTN01]
MTELAEPVPSAPARLRAGMLPPSEANRLRERRHRAVLAAADEIFASNGFHGTCMDDVAAHAHVSKPLLYQHFPSKVELYLAVVQNHVDALVAAVRDALGVTTGSRQRVYAAVAAYFDFIDRNPHGYRLLFEADPSVDPRVHRSIRAGNQACIDAICAALLCGSELDPKRARVLAVGLAGASRVTARHWLKSGFTIPKQDAVETTVALCWGGLSAVGATKRT